MKAKPCQLIIGEFSEKKDNKKIRMKIIIQCVARKVLIDKKKTN